MPQKELERLAAVNRYLKLDSISPNAFGSAMGYYVTSANKVHYTMSDCDIKVIKLELCYAKYMK